MKARLIILFTFSSCFCIGQGRNSMWCFGDSAGINFSNLSQPLPVHFAVKSRGSCVSISNYNGTLQFYYSYDPSGMTNGFPFNNGNVYNRNDSLMTNGDKIITGLWYMEGVIVDYPADNNKYYLFTIGVTGNYGLYYSTIDMTLDSGRGAVTQKNIQLLPYAADDGLTAVKHGNGRDWWVIFRRCGAFDGVYDNKFYKYLISPSGINLVDSQSIGYNDISNTFSYIFNKTGDKLAMVMYNGIVETYDFDRCTGNLSNYIVVRQLSTSFPPKEMFSGEFSPNGRYLYVSTNGAYDSTFVIQVDLQNPLLYAAADTVGIISYPIAGGGFLRRAPDNKIYFSCAWYDGFNFNFPYPDTTFNTYNTNFSVINSPDSLGAACTFTPYSFNLGGARTYYGLPNNPDYGMPRDSGSVCDTIQWTGSPPSPKGGEKEVLYTTYISSWDKLFINAQHLKGTTYMLTVSDVMGRLVFKERGKLQPPPKNTGQAYFTKDLDCAAFANGLYIVTLTTDKEMLSKKFVKSP